ncbi:MAG: tetratricopeptide repeat protein [Ginsengibacter sp.]
MSAPINTFFLFSFLILFAVFNAECQSSLTDSIRENIQSLPRDTNRVKAIVRNVLFLQSHRKQSKEEEAMLQEGLQIATELNYQHGMAECYNLLGVYYRNTSQYVRAVSMHEKALELSRSSKDSITMAYALNSMGVAYRRLDENEKAFKFHFEALGIAKAIGDRKNRTISMNSIANIYLSMGQYKNAIEEFEECLALEKEAQNNTGIAINYANIGAAYEGLKQIDEAISFYKKSLQFNLIGENDKGLAICYNLLGKAYLIKGDYNLALQYIRKALPYNNKLQDKINVAENYITIGSILQKSENIKEAISAMQQGLKIAEEIGSKSLVIDANVSIAQAEKLLGNNSSAYDALNKAYQLRDSLYIQMATPEMSKLRTLYELDKKNDEIKLLSQANEIKQLKLDRGFSIVIAAIVLLLFSGIGLYAYSRYRRQRNHRTQLQFELQSLRSQMNPHFIFNSLNSIHKYIWDNQAEEASEYLTKFSKLIRMILENSRVPSIYLKDEIDFLNLYVELELLRFHEKFEYSIQPPAQVEANEIFIPSMIIQPFVENAIWHGLAPKENGKGKLSIRFSIEDSVMICEIEDNGIGREKAIQLKAERSMTHNSMGIQVTEDRIELLKKTSGNKSIEINIKDLKNSDNEATGTIVRIVLPLNYAF